MSPEQIMKKSLTGIAALLLCACAVQRQAEVSEVDANSGIVRLTYGQAMLQDASTDRYVADGTATKACQKLGYASAFAYGQPVTTCSVTSGSLCVNERVTLQYQCRAAAAQIVGW